jgi:integrase
MATVRFRVRGKKENSPIYLRFSANKKDRFELKTGYFCNPEYFNNDTGKVRNVASYQDKEILKANLLKLENDITNALNKTNEFSKEWLQTEIDRHHGKTPENEKRFTLAEMFDVYIEYKRYSAVTPVTESTLKSYNATTSRLDNFQKHQKKVYFIDEVGSDFKDEFVKWAKSIANYQPETFKKSIKHFKTICRYAKNKKKLPIDETLFVKEESSKKTKKKKEIKFPHLSLKDLEKIKGFNGSDYLENARDWLIISCWTGCRVSDLMQLTTDKIILTIKGERALSYTQEKTGITVEIPLHPDVEKILENRNGFPRAISHQKYNNYIKDVCELSKINEIIEGGKMDKETNRKVFSQFPKYELVTSHIGRRSFATNHYGKLSNHKIMQVTGHRTERQFLEYIGKRDTEHISDFALFWNKQQEERKQSEKQKIS